MSNRAIYRKILVAVDLTHHPENILAKAAALANDPEAVLHLVHVITPIDDALYASGLSMLSPVMDTSSLQQEAVEAAKTRLAELATTCPMKRVRTEVLLGQPGREICLAAKNDHSDLIVIGSHGKHGAQLLLGSTATAVLHHAPCDTLAVRT